MVISVVSSILTRIFFYLSLISQNIFLIMEIKLTLFQAPELTGREYSVMVQYPDHEMIFSGYKPYEPITAFSNYLYYHQSDLNYDKI